MLAVHCQFASTIHFIGDELLSDAFPQKPLHGGIIIEVQCRNVTKGPVKIDTGANPSAEGGEDEAVDDSAETVIDVIDNFGLEETTFDKKSFTLCMKDYLKKIKCSIQGDDEIKAFESNAQEYFKGVLANFNDYSFYTGSSMNPEAMTIILRYEGSTPFLQYWKHGMKGNKY